jgi:hypothetical protein
MQRISVYVTSAAGGCFSSHLHALLKEARDVYHHPLLNDIWTDCIHFFLCAVAPRGKLRGYICVC